MILRDKSKFSK